MGIEGVIVDLVQEITEAVSEMIKPSKEQGGEEILMEREEQIRAKAKPQFMENELSFLLKLVPELNSWSSSSYKTCHSSLPFLSWNFKLEHNPRFPTSL